MKLQALSVAFVLFGVCHMANAGVDVDTSTHLRSAIDKVPGFKVAMPPSPDGLTMSAAMGLVNKALNRPAVFATKLPSDEGWFQTVVEKEKSVSNTNFKDSTVDEVVAFAVSSGAAKGYLLFDPNEQFAFATVVTLCGVHSLIPTTSAAGIQGLKMFMDTRGMWKDELEATQYAVEYLLTSTRSDRIALQTPGLLGEGFLVDLAVKDGLFVAWLPNMCKDGDAQHDLYGTITTHSHFGANEISIMGYFPASEVVAECSPTNSEISLVSDFSVSLSFHSLLPSVTRLYQAKAQAVPEYDASKIYVALVSSDGDNMQLCANSLRPRMEERVSICGQGVANKGICPPVTWTISNRLMEFGPTILRYFYAAGNETGVDSFFMGPSGFGFLHPSVNTKQDILTKKTVEAAEALGMEGYVHWDRYNNEAGMEKSVAAYGGTAVRGVFSPVQPAVPEVVNGVVTFTETKRWFTSDKPEDIAGHLNGLGAGSTVYLYKIHDVSFADVEKFAKNLNDNVVMLGYRELIGVARKKHGLDA